MATVKDIAAYFEELVPTNMKMDFDNPGFIVGTGTNVVKKVLLALDITDAVIEEAIAFGADLILSHHPLFFSTRNASTEDLIGRKLVAMLGNGISAICLHTNLDAVKGGVNDALMYKLGIPIEGILEEIGVDSFGEKYGMGRYGTIEPISLEEYLPVCKSALECNGLRYISGGSPVHKIAVCGGSGSSMIQLVHALGCDTFITADVKHNGFMDAAELGINLIDAGHFSTENVVVPILQRMLSEKYPEIESKISVRHMQPEQYYV